MTETVRAARAFSPGLHLLIILAAGAACCSTGLFAQQVSPPVLIGHSIVDGATLGIPRWKGYMSLNNPQNFWACYANGGSGYPTDMTFTTNGGISWSDQEIQISADGRVDFHLSVFGRNEELYCTYPDNNNFIAFRKFNNPAHGNEDRGPLVHIANTTAAHRSNIMVQNNGRIWLFTRRGSYPNQNVLYHYSDNNGQSWTTGTAHATAANNVRVGSMPYVGGSPVLVVLYIGDPRGYEYYMWNGSSFVSNPDHSIYAVNMSQVRSFTHNVVSDSAFHLVFGQGHNLRHVWKYYNGGTGSWHNSVIENSLHTADNEWLPISVSRGDELYIFYCRKSADSQSSSKIYYKKWSQATQSWTDPVLVSAALPGNRDPNTCFRVPRNSGYIPVYWSSTEGSYNIYFSRIILSPVTRDDIDNKIIEFRQGEASLQDVLDLIEQYNSEQ